MKFYMIYLLILLNDTFLIGACVKGAEILFSSLYFDVAAIAILICILSLHLMNQNKLMLQSRIFTWMILTTLFASIADILDVYGSAHALQFPMIYHQITSYVYFLMLNSTPFTYAFYTVSLKKNHLSVFNRIEKILLFVPILVLYLVVFSNFFTNGIFYYDANMQYHRGVYQFILYTISFYYMLFGAIYTTIFMRKNLTKAHKVSVYLFVFLGCGGTIIQVFLSQLYISTFAITICILITLFIIQKPSNGVDAKVGIPNYNSFAQMFQLQITGTKASSLFLVYIENVALMNQAIGVSKVDSLLNQIGKYLAANSNNNTFYLGGNVFAVIQNTTDESHLASFVKQVNSRFEKPWNYEDTEIYMKIRLLELHIPKDANTIEGIQAFKDFLKDPVNRNKQYLLAKDSSIAMTRRKMQIEQAIKRAIAEDGFEIYYQPIYSTSEKRIHSAEALLRLFDPELGFIPPDEFIIIAENNGMILEIGDIVFEKVCKFMSQQSTDRLGIQYIEVNLSVVQCMQEELAENLLAVMQKYNIPYGSINLEITETAANSSPIMLIRNMNKLYSKGITFSLDDFGTGYSNMNAIMELPLDIIKFDKSMISSADHSSKGKIIFLSSVAMVKQMNMKIVAEGIETEEQKELMEQSGVEYLQGYLFSKPVPEEAFVDYVKQFNFAS